MKVSPTPLNGAFVLEPRLLEDARGSFMETFNARDFTAATGQNVTFVQDNQSRSKHGVLRGMHYQVIEPQGKLVRVTRGAVFDVIVDMRRSSPTLGQWSGLELSEDNRHQLWIPPGFAHGFTVLSESADVCYKATAHFTLAYERCVKWNDPTLGIAWPLKAPPLLSAKDSAAGGFIEAELCA